MKKLALAVLALLFTASFAYAEMGATTYSSNFPNFREETVYIGAYNATATDISSNNVVILDVSTATVAANKSTGACITTTTSQDSNLWVGVTDEVIAAGSCGRVCVRGPHRVLFSANTGAAAVGASLSTYTTAGYVSRTSGTSGLDSKSVAGVMLATAADPALTSTGVPSDNAAVYWMWVGK